jgi:hypothetical protein
LSAVGGAATRMDVGSVAESGEKPPVSGSCADATEAVAAKAIRAYAIVRLHGRITRLRGNLLLSSAYGVS